MEKEKTITFSEAEALIIATALEENIENRVIQERKHNYWRGFVSGLLFTSAVVTLLIVFTI